MLPLARSTGKEIASVRHGKGSNDTLSLSLSLSHLRFFRWAQLAQRNKGIVESARYASLQVHVTAWIFVCKSSRNGTIDET